MAAAVLAPHDYEAQQSDRKCPLSCLPRPCQQKSLESNNSKAWLTAELLFCGAYTMARQIRELKPNHSTTWATTLTPRCIPSGIAACRHGSRSVKPPSFLLCSTSRQTWEFYELSLVTAARSIMSHQSRITSVTDSSGNCQDINLIEIRDSTDDARMAL